MFERCHWLNEPREWRLGAEGLSVVTDLNTDFWRETHYGFTRHSGHFFGYNSADEFTATIRVRGQYLSLYDQAGIMVLLDEAHWLKAGIELSDGEALLGSVLTNGHSDWATSRWQGNPEDVWLRVTVAAGVLRLQASEDGQRWPLVRLCPFPTGEPSRVGPMCCTPERAGLKVLFSDFTVGSAAGKHLHDLS
jgi:regulation of enolase protein 1 (concanavalin A-like superfamily)